jgi:hypothetical protein
LTRQVRRRQAADACIGRSRRHPAPAAVSGDAEIERETMRIRYRLVGTRVAEANGSDYTNRYLDECNFAVEPLLNESYRRLIATRAPVFAYYEWNKRNWTGRRGSVGASETGFFPLSSDGDMVDFAISIADSDVRPYPGETA